NSNALASGATIQLGRLIHLPRHPRDASQLRARQSSRKTPQRRREAATHIQHARWSLALQVQPMHHLNIHLLQHPFAIKRIHSPPEVPEVHIELRTPRRIIGSRLRVVLLQADLRTLRTGNRNNPLHLVHRAPPRRTAGNSLVSPVPTRISDRSVAAGNFFICPYQSCNSPRNSLIAAMRLVTSAPVALSLRASSTHR